MSTLVSVFATLDVSKTLHSLTCFVCEGSVEYEHLVLLPGPLLPTHRDGAALFRDGHSQMGREDEVPPVGVRLHSAVRCLGVRGLISGWRYCRVTISHLIVPGESYEGRHACRTISVIVLCNQSRAAQLTDGTAT